MNNPYLSTSLGRLFLTTAAPIILIMAVNGLYTVVDAYFLGLYVGANALTAVTLMFPLFMLLIALSTLVGTGMASIFARDLGAGKKLEAQGVLSSAMVLAFLVSALLVVCFLIWGNDVILLAAKSDPVLGDMGNVYIAPLIFGSPILFFLTVQGDAMRSEGRVGLMALIAISSAVLNGIFNYILIVQFDMGVLGSSMGTLAAQFVAFAVVIFYRLSKNSQFVLFGKLSENILKIWGRIIVLGLPGSLNFLGISLLSAVEIYSVQKWVSGSYFETVAAYGIITRIMTFVFLPMLGLNLATQSIIGNNFGAGLFERSNKGLKIALVSIFCYSTLVEIILLAYADSMGFIFVSDKKVVSEVGRILPVLIIMFFVAGPMMVLAGYFQAIGNAGKSAILGLTRTFVFAIPLTIILPYFIGEIGIWYATPVASVAMIVLAILVLSQNAKKTNTQFGLLFKKPA